jgi:hypothetical protein
VSANTNISEGGKARPFGPVKALMVEGDNGKFYSWYPESEKALGTLSVDKNGVYRASDKGVYGWSSVYVNVATSDSVTGRDPDTGEEVVVRPDPETGEITETVVPVEIRVITPPTNPYGVYVDGQTITKDGMVVKAYGANGDEMLTVPVGEITLNPTQAHYDESTDTRGNGTATSELDTGMVQPIAYSGSAGLNQTTETRIFTATYSGTIAAYPSSTNIGLLFASSTETVGTVTTTSINIKTEETSTNTEDIRATGNYTYNGKTVYYAYQTLIENETQSITHGPINTINRAPGGADAWTMIYGTIEEEPAGSHQQITVSWPRPGDGAILETTFDILVGPHGGGPTGED